MKEAHFTQIDFLQKLSLSKIRNVFFYKNASWGEFIPKTKT